MNGFTIWGVDFFRHVEELDGYDNHEFPATYQVDLITNYAALKHIVRSGKVYVADNDNDMNRVA